MNVNFVFHHIGIATRSIDKSAEIYFKLGYQKSEIVIEPSQNVKICFLSKKDNPLMELVEPLNGSTPVSNIIKNSGTTPYHICYEVEDMQESLKKLESLRFRQLFDPMLSIAMENGMFCYLFSANTGLIELYQKKTIF